MFGKIIKQYIRQFQYKRQGIKASPKRISNRVTIEPPCNLDEDVIIQNDVVIGRSTYIGPWAFLFSHVSIGRYVSIAAHTLIGGYEHEQNHLSTKQAIFDQTKTVIGHDVWIGGNVIIKRGVTVGHGAIIGAGAVVTKNVPPYAVVVGNPAKVVRYRFDDDTIKNLLSLKWWDLDAETVKQLPKDDVQKCIEILKQISGK